MHRFGVCLCLVLCVAASCAAESPTSGSPIKILAEALSREDITAIHKAVDLGREKLGDQAGIPEVADEYDPVPKSAKALSKADAQRGFAPHLDRLKKLAHWGVGLDPTKMTDPLRAPAAVISGCVAMFELYELTKDVRYLDSAKRSADWASKRPLVTNWNYNSFSVLLLAKAYSVTHDTRYLDVAITKAHLGVIPGQLQVGPRAGRWMDPHNARPAYHYLMLAALTELAAVLPPDHPESTPIMAALKLGLTSRNQEIIERGVMTKDKAVEALILVEHHFGQDESFMSATHSKAALDHLCRYCSEQARRNRLPLSPRGWGRMLVFLSTGS